MIAVDKFEALKIGIASSEVIRKWRSEKTRNYQLPYSSS